jgi:hypothetical protein
VAAKQNVVSFPLYSWRILLGGSLSRTFILAVFLYSLWFSTAKANPVWCSGWITYSAHKSLVLGLSRLPCARLGSARRTGILRFHTKRWSEHERLRLRSSCYPKSVLGRFGSNGVGCRDLAGGVPLLGLVQWSQTEKN